MFLTNKPVALRFERFQVGPKTYTNLVVSSRTTTDVFIRHQSGIGNFKVDELSPQQLIQLGYESESAPEKAKESQESPLAAASKATQSVIKSLSTPATHAKLGHFVQRVRARVTGAPDPGDSGDPGQVTPLSLESLQDILPHSAVVFISFFLASLPLIYFFFCYTARMVCKKAGLEPGFMIWLPILSLIPLLRAAKLSPWLFLVMLVPIVNLLVGVIWCFRIARARGKGLLTTLGLICPPTSPLAWLYLAYSK